jgi:hypothetical protein
VLNATQNFHIHPYWANAKNVAEPLNTIQVCQENAQSNSLEALIFGDIKFCFHPFIMKLA